VTSDGQGGGGGEADHSGAPESFFQKRLKRFEK